MTLTIQDLGALGELLGSVAVLAPLVYLALQTRQNTAAIAAQLDSTQFSARVSLDLAIASDYVGRNRPDEVARQAYQRADLAILQRRARDLQHSRGTPATDYHAKGKLQVLVLRPPLEIVIDHASSLAERADHVFDDGLPLADLVL